MKVCPRCQARFIEDINFCLNDGSPLNELDHNDAEPTLFLPEKTTISAKNPLTENLNNQRFPQQAQNYTQKKGIHPLFIIGGVVGIGLLLISGLFGGIWILREKIKSFPTPTPRVGYTPYKTPTPKSSPTPEEKPELKIEAAGKVKRSFGQQYLKYLVTNTSDKIIINPNISVTLYQGDVKLKDLNGESKLNILKPGQTVPIWVDLFFGTDKYTEAKTVTAAQTKYAAKNEAQLFPKLTITDTKMTVTRETSMFNNYQYAENWYNVTGVVENTEYDTISPMIYVIFYDENSNIVGVDDQLISGLKRGEKQQFKAGSGEISSLFGKAKRFEIIVTDGSRY